MLKTRYHKLRLQFSLWRCRTWNSWTKWLEAKGRWLVANRRWLFGAYMLLVLLVGILLMSRFQARLREIASGEGNSSFIYNQGSDTNPHASDNATSHADTLWEERRFLVGPEPRPSIDNADLEPQQSSESVVNIEPLAINTIPKEDGPTELVAVQSPVLEELYLPLVDAPVQNGYSLSAKWATLGDWRPHLAVDLAAQSGAAVQAAASGVVSKIVTNDPYWGTIVVIDHGGGWSTSYSNIDKPAVKAGERVAACQLIGQVSENPPLELLDPLHLHFILLQNGQPIDPSSKWR
ncbi:MAG TPA: hypothetical protein DDZ53_06255 [Firmicutes bacterium]|nr:hypothetical protein [Bacillota bacterium]